MTKSDFTYVCVIPAGGVGSRFKGAASLDINEQNDCTVPEDKSSAAQALPKQLHEILGKTILEHSIADFLTDHACQAIVISAHIDYQQRIASLFKSINKVAVIEGGQSRAESVQRGLQYCLEKHSEDSWVMVHDAARPNLRQSDIDKLKQILSKTTHSSRLTDNSEPLGAILATASLETLKQAHLQADNAIVNKTLNRDLVWQAKTPQVFRLGELNSALSQVVTTGESLVSLTDESAAMERIGAKIFLVEGRTDNIKLTTQADWHLLECILQQR